MHEVAPSDGVIVVNEDRRAAHFLSALLVGLTVVGWWALNAFVEMTPDNRIAGNVVGGGMTAIFLGMWIYQIRYPARLEISHPLIAYKRRGRHRTVTLQRTTGDLAFETRTAVIGGHGSVTPVLAIPDDPQTAIGIATFDRKQIKKACETAGWRFSE